MKKIYIRFFLLFLTGLSVALYFFWAKDAKEKNKLFDDSFVHRIDISIDSNDLSMIMDFPDSTILKKATLVFHYKNSVDSLENIGFRIKGNTSRYQNKKSFKLSFNTFDKGNKYKGLEKLNLNAYTNDPTHLRAHLACKAYENMGLKVIRSSFAEVYINNVYRGLYNVGEHIDEEFVKRVFDSKEGNLYKCLSPADLAYHGDKKEDYLRVWDNSPIYNLKNNKKENDYSGLITFMDILNNSPTEDLDCLLEKCFNVEDYLKMMAVDVVIGNWDSYLYSANNYYLYENPKSGKVEFIPYDLDNTFGIDWVKVDWAKRKLYKWPEKSWLGQDLDTIKKVASEEEMEMVMGFYNFWMNDTIRPLYYRLLEIEKYRNQFNYNVNKTLDFLNSQEFDAEIDLLMTMLQPSLEMDSLDSYSWEQINRALDAGLDVYEQPFAEKIYYLPYGIRDFIQITTANIRSQLESIHPFVSLNNVVFKEKDKSIFLSVEVEGKASDLSAYFFENENSLLEIVMNDEGKGGDKKKGDGIYSFKMDKEDVVGSKFFIVADAPEGAGDREPCSGYIEKQ